MKFKEKFYNFLNWLSKYTQSDITYVIGNSFWWILGRTLAFLSSFLILVAFGKLAPKEVYGTYQYVISLAAIIGIFGLPGLDTALVRAISQGKEKTFFLCEKTRLKWGFLTAFFSFLISGWYFFYKNFPLAYSFLIVGFLLPISTVFSLYLIYWYGKKRFDLQNKYYVVHNFLGAGILISVIFLKPDIVWVVFGYYFGFTLATFLFWYKTRKQVKKNSEEDKEAVSFGKHLTLMALPGLISSQVDNVILWQFTNPKSVAVYAYALRLIERISELIPFSALALPKMAEKDLTQDSVKKRIFDKFLKLFLVAIPSTLFYILICPFLFKIFFPAYSQSVIYSQVLALTLILFPFNFLATAFLAQMKKKELYFLNVAPQVLKVGLFFLLIPLFKIWGGVFSILISQIFYSLLVLYFFKKF